MKKLMATSENPNGIEVELSNKQIQEIKAQLAIQNFKEIINVEDFKDIIQSEAFDDVAQTVSQASQTFNFTFTKIWFVVL